MTKPLRTAVIPAGGNGTRLLPLTRAIPKEMIPLLDKPLIQYAVEEAVASGIEHIVFVTRGPAAAVESYFTLDSARDTHANLDSLRSLIESARFSFVSQPEPLGLGHAVLCAREFVGNEPFAVLLADIVIASDVPCLRQMLSAFQPGRSIVATQTIHGPAIGSYGVLDGLPDPADPRLFRCSGMVEKPSYFDAPSAHAIAGRYILSPGIFEILDHTPPGAAGEVQLTDALNTLAAEEEVFGFAFEGRRFHAGDKLGLFEATVALALLRPDLARPLRDLLKTLPL